MFNMRSLPTLLYLTTFTLLCSAQFPATPSGLTVIDSKLNSQVKISYKQTTICETSPGVRSYSGYVHLPADVLSGLGDYNISTFFLYFEARNNPSTAPLAIYLAGGPGESSTYTALSSESGPCYVNLDANSTTLNPWSFNNHVNMLYIDQPVQAGFSYQELVTGVLDIETGIVTPQTFATSPPTSNTTFGPGMFPSQDPAQTTNNTVSSAKALWLFAEHWLSSFPEYSTSSNKISVWANSYGGYWGPATATLFNKKLTALSSQADHPLKAKNLTIDTLGITNGCIDELYAIEGYPQFAYNNTYGVHFIPKSVYEAAMHNITKPDGCLDLIKQCRQLGHLSDPDFLGSNATVNEVCTAAFEFCAGYIVGAFDVLNNRSDFDVAVPSPQPCPYYLPVSTYLNTAPVQADLGVPLNFTYDSAIVTADFGLPSPYTFLGTADGVRQAGVADLEYLLQNGVKIALVYGDRDYRCPWTGAETTAKAAKWAHQSGFEDAGYQIIDGISRGARGGVVKQYGQLSFSRIFDAGHMVSAYAPEAVYRVFMRSMFDDDVATGKVKTNATYHTTGPTESWGWRNKLPAKMPETCMVLGHFQEENPWTAVLQ